MTLVNSGQLCLGSAGGIAADRSVQAEFSLPSNVCLATAFSTSNVTGTCLNSFYGASAFSPKDYEPIGYLFADTPTVAGTSGLWLAGGFNFSIYMPSAETPVPTGDITFANPLGIENSTTSTADSAFTITGTASDGEAVALRIFSLTTDGRRPIDFDVAGGAGDGPQPHAASVYQAWTQIDVNIPYTISPNDGAIVPWQFKRSTFLGTSTFFGPQYAYTYNVNPNSIANVATGTVTGGDGSYEVTNPFVGGTTYFQRNGWGPAIVAFELDEPAFGSGTGFDITSWAGCDSTSRVTGIHVNSRADNAAFTSGQSHSVRVIGAGTPPTAPFFILQINDEQYVICLLYTSPSPRDS